MVGLIGLTDILASGTGFFIQWAKRAQAKVEQAQVIAEERGSKNMAGTSRGTNPLVDSVR